MNKPLVVQHNTLIESTYKMSITEQRLVRMCISQLRRDVSNNGREFTISIYDYNRTFGVSDTRKALERASKELIKRYVEYNKPHERNGKRWDKSIISVIESASFNDDEICIQFTPSIMPLLEGLRGEHTTYPLNDIVQLQSVYSVRFYELFKQYLSIGSRTITVDEMRCMFGLQKKYKLHKDFKKNVIDIAVNEINEFSPLRIEYKQVKKGRRIHAYEFTIDKKMSKLQMKNTANKRARERAISELKKALKLGQKVTVLGVEVREINGAILSFKNNTSRNVHELMLEADCEFTVG